MNVVGVTPKATRHKGEQTEGTRRLSFFNKLFNILEEQEKEWRKIKQYFYVFYGVLSLRTEHE